MPNNEQIQALKAAAEKAKEYGGIAMYSKAIKANEEFKEAATPEAILSMLAEREADKALIAELEQKHCGSALMQREEHHVCVVNKLMERIAELESRTLTVTFNPIPMGELGNKNEGKTHPYMFGAGYNSAVVSCECALKRACAATGITLVVGGEDAQG